MSSPKISRVVPKLAKTTIRIIVKRVQTETSPPNTIQDLPDDVLDVVFEFFLILHKDLLLILHVSTRWRALALANPHLWTFISIDRQFYPDSSPDISEPSEFGGALKFDSRYQICREYSRFLDALHRAGSLPIQVCCGGDWKLSDHNPSIEKILKAPASHRIEALALERMGWWDFPPGDQLDQMSFPILQQLTLSADEANWPFQFLRNIDRGAPRLTDLRLQIKLDDSAINLRIWSNLQSLEVQPLLIPGSTLKKIIQRCTKLTKFRSGSDDWPSHHYKLYPEMLAKLPEVHLGCDPSRLQKLNLQNLQTLHYRNFCPYYYDLRLSFAFPELTTLKLQTDMPLNYISGWKMPRLRSLSINYQRNGQSQHKHVFTSIPTVTDFHMEHGSLTHRWPLCFNSSPMYIIFLSLCAVNVIISTAFQISSKTWFNWADLAFAPNYKSSPLEIRRIQSATLTIIRRQ